MQNALWRWKQSRRLTYRQVAAVLELKVAQAKKLGAGLVPCTPALARHIEKMSNGEISAEELVFPERFQSAKKRRGAA